MPLNYQLHTKQWINCTRCSLCKVRKKVVLARGKIPCDVLYIGEAPGLSEDILGLPFIGPAGKLLDQQIRQAEQEAGREFRKLWTNLVGCIPKNPDTNRKNEEPLPEEVEACNPRVEQLIKLAKPRIIVLVGDLAKAQGKIREWGIPNKALLVGVRHPAFILRVSNPAQKQHEYDRVVVQLATAFRTLGEEVNA